MKLCPFIALGQGMIPLIYAAVLVPNVLSLVSLAISVFGKEGGRSLPGFILALFGFAPGLFFLCTEGLPKTTHWMGIGLFIQFPLGVLALAVSLRKRRKIPPLASRRGNFWGDEL